MAIDIKTAYENYLKGLTQPTAKPTPATIPTAIESVQKGWGGKEGAGGDWLGAISAGVQGVSDIAQSSTGKRFMAQQALNEGRLDAAKEYLGEADVAQQKESALKQAYAEAEQKRQERLGETFKTERGFEAELLKAGIKPEERKDEAYWTRQISELDPSKKIPPEVRAEMVNQAMKKGYLPEVAETGGFLGFGKRYAMESSKDIQSARVGK